MQNLLIVMLGGAFGSGARHLTGRLMLALLGPNWPWGTLTVNIVGGLLMGLLVGTLARFPTVSGEGWRLLLGVGVLGGYTTFSSFSLDVVAMIERGAWAGALAYVLASLFGAVLAVFTGLFIMRAVTA
ncbi:fluoride efflux transporter CrcB [Sphingomonas sp. TX0543]|uniref:fluoride efflux transporter CrcB n=1 Tax=unclassified Sphingomonas TaxID=196159 RepID=UPI0010F6AB79|nr:fluoride efflux transporter CrcB [Sphingomonas sp. 3P27F8]